MNTKILKIAQYEFNQAKEFFEIEQTGLGERFEIEIKEALLRSRLLDRSTLVAGIRSCNPV